MTVEGAGAFPKEEQDTEQRKTLIDTVLALREELPRLVAAAIAPLREDIAVLGAEAGRTNSFLSAHAVRLDSLGPQAPLNGLAGKTVLVVDDESAFARAVHLGLTRRGAQVHIAQSIDVAVGFVRTVRLDAALVDLRLPRAEDGLELARWICRSQNGCAVVVTSGLLDAPGLDSLPVARIPKPFGLDDLERVLCDAMGHGAQSLRPDSVPSTLPPPPRTGFPEPEPDTEVPDTQDETPQAKREG